jgi:hypothetical protein
MLTDVALRITRRAFAPKHPRPILAVRLRLRRARVVVYHACVFPHGVRFECPTLCGDAVDVHRTVAALRRNVLVERIPGDALHVVGVFGDFMHAFAWGGGCEKGMGGGEERQTVNCSVYSSTIICAPR